MFDRPTTFDKSGYLNAYINHSAWMVKKCLEKENYEEIFSFRYIKHLIYIFVMQYPKQRLLPLEKSSQKVLDITRNPQSFIDLYLTDYKSFYEPYKHMCKLKTIYSYIVLDENLYLYKELIENKHYALKEYFDNAIWTVKNFLEKDFHIEVFSYEYITNRIYLFIYCNINKYYDPIRAKEDYMYRTHRCPFLEHVKKIYEEHQSFIDLYLKDLKPFYTSTNEMIMVNG